MDSDWRTPAEARTIVLGLAAMAAALFLAWQLREALVLAFAAVVGAVILDGAVRGIRRAVPQVPRGLALGLVGALMLVVFGVPAWLIGEEVRNQFSNVLGQLPEAIRALEAMLGLELLPRAPAPPEGGRLSEMTSTVQDLSGQLATMGATMAGGASAAVVVVVGAFFLAADPALYRSGVMLVVPYEQHARVMGAMSAAGDALRLWLVAQLVSMAIVGSVVGVGAWWIGLPAPLAIGMFAALTEFVPTIGPFVGATPAMLLALAMGQDALLWTVLLFVVVQQLESNLVSPIVQRRMAKIPPALLLFAVVAAGLLFGLAGVIVAAPLAVVVLVLVKKLYVREVLGKETELPGEE